MAGKRWMRHHAYAMALHHVPLCGDALYSKPPFCPLALESVRNGEGQALEPAAKILVADNDKTNLCWTNDGPALRTCAGGLFMLKTGSCTNTPVHWYAP
jgi:hypothetical protein